MIRVQPIEGTWQTLGSDLYPGIEPEGVTPAWGPNGPESLSFSLQRPPHRVHADLLPFTPVEWYPTNDASGDPLWSGYTMQAPPGGYGESTSVSCVGWHFYREDAPASVLYVHEDLSAWRDARSFPEANLATRTAAWQVDASGGEILLALPIPNTAVDNAGCSVILDLGATRAKRVVFTYTSGDPPDLWSLILTGADTPLGTAEATLMASNPVAGPTTLAQTFTTPRRYVEIEFRNRTGTTVTGTAASWIKLTAVKVFAATAYESGNESIFRADTGIKETRTRLPLLSTDETQIETVSYAIRHAAWIAEDATERARQEAFNDYHGYRLGVDAQKRLFFKAQPSVPRLQVDQIAPGVDYRATSTNDGSEIYNAVSVRGKSGAGTDLRIDRVISDFVTTARPDVLSRRSRVRSFTLTVAAATDVVAMDGLARAWLLAHRSVPHKAQLSIAADDAVTDLQAGQVVKMGSLGRYYGEMVRVLSVPDPDTGALQSRDGVIASVQGTGPVSLALDSERRSLEALMLRMGVVQT